MIKQITIFCASSRKVPSCYFEATEEVANILTANAITAVYGGGAVGLMGRLADTMLKKNGKIKGIIPSFMMEVEWGHPEIEDLMVVRDMHERKKELIHKTDAVLVLPGGTGTLEEAMEVITLKRLGLFTKPIIFLNTNNFYKPLVDFFNTMEREHFIRKEHQQMWSVIDKPSQLLEAIKTAPDWDKDKINQAAV